jgi:hypothetical protein
LNSLTMTPTPRSRPAIIFFSSQKLTRKAYRLSTLKFSATSHFPFDKSTACLLYDAQSGAVSLGDLSTFSAPQDDVLIFFLTHHRAYAIFRSAKSNVLSLSLIPIPIPNSYFDIRFYLIQIWLSKNDNFHFSLRSTNTCCADGLGEL